jgi:fumarylpyruvate hydrolase
MTYLFPPTIASVAVGGASERFPVRRIFCVGRNYAAHAREMGSDPNAEPPFFFTKPADAVVANGETIPYPPNTANLHHEIELVVAIGVGGETIAPTDAGGHIFGYGVGIDLTRRDLQLAARDKGRPWDWGKAFDRSAPCSDLLPVAAGTAPLAAGRITLAVNGTMRQSADLSDMIWGVPDIIAALSRSIALRPGDLIYTGTPENVGPLQPGDHVVGEVEGVGRIELRIAAR